MATIAKIREKYPQYSDMPDAALADALHRKFYADMTKPDFYAKIGLGAAPTPSLYGSEVPQVNAQGQLLRQPDAMPSERTSFRDFAGAVVETPLALSTGIVAGIIAPYVGVARTLTGGQYGTQEGSKQGDELARKVYQALTYQPQTAGGQATVSAIGKALEPLQALPFAQTSSVGAMAPAAARQTLRGVANEAGYLKNAIAEIPSVKAAKEARVADSFARGPQIDAAKLAQKYDISLDPAVSNSNVRNRIRTGLIGSADLDNRLAKANEPKWTTAVKKDLGLGDETPLTNPKVFDDIRARDDISGPYQKVREIKSIVVQPDAIGKIDELRVAPLYGDTGQAAATNAFLDKVKTDLQSGGSGSKLLKSIQQMRQEAQNVLRAEKAGNPIAPAARMEADAKMKATKVLESMIDDNITDIGARDAFIKARQRMAQTYDIESATDFGTGKIDPTKFAKMVSDGEPVSGIVLDFGTIASNFPEIATVGAVGQKLLPSFTRASPGGALGGIIGSAIGTPFIGGPIGAVIGAGTSEIIRRVAANKMTTPEFQFARATPRDFRPQPSVNALRPVEPSQSNIVPFDPRNALLEPEVRPNFTIPQNPLPRAFGDVRPEMPPAGFPRLPPTKSTELSGLAAENARRSRMAAIAEAETAAAEGRAPRAPTSGGILFDLDPITGKLRPASQGIRGATLETFQDYTSTLRSATEKLSAGKKFALDAAEKIAFDKTRVDLAEIVPGVKGLTDKAIAERMMDRNWIESTIKTAREKAAAFEEIEKRARSAEMMGARAESARSSEVLRQATEAKGRLRTTLEALEESLANLRPDTSRKTQGPKTRGAIRNNLQTEPEVKNNLIQ